MSAVIIEKLDSLKKADAMNITDVANVLGTTPATVSRWNSGKASPQRTKERLLVQLEYIVDRLQEFYSHEQARLWLFTRHQLLDGRRPGGTDSGRRYRAGAFSDRAIEWPGLPVACK